jgi:hypothetical protein
VKLPFNSEMIACKSAGLNESINSCSVGFAGGEGDGDVADRDRIRGALGTTADGKVGTGDWPTSNAGTIKIDVIKATSSNRDISVVFRCYP